MKMAYLPRLVDRILDQDLADVAAVAIEGAKGVGKTATASRRARAVLALNDPRVRSAVTANFDLVAEVERPTFVDEWQLVPDTWERIRQAVDAEPIRPGQFLLAGSAGLASGSRIHSGAGRIARITMRPLSIAERGIESPSVSFEALHHGDTDVAGSTPLRVRDYVDEILRSGFPGIRGLTDRGQRRQLDGYLDRIIDHDLSDAGITVRRPAALSAWLRAYAAATATTADYTKILDAATAGRADKPARSTVDGYREHLARLFILDPLEAWTPAFAPLKRLTFAPKHHLVDPALAARLVGVDAQGLMTGDGERVAGATGTWLGALFESLVVQSIRVYAQAIGGQVRHLRTKGGEHEIDIIVETEDRRCTAIEVKLADTVGDRDTEHLHWLAAEVGPRLADRVIVNTGPRAYRRADGVAVVPLALLGP